MSIPQSPKARRSETIQPKHGKNRSNERKNFKALSEGKPALVLVKKRAPKRKGKGRKDIRAEKAKK